MIRVPISSPTRDFDVMPQMVFLPWPPSVNRYWRRVGAKVLISAEGRAYRDEVIWRCRVARLRAYERAEPVVVRLMVSAPDRRRRDLDNLPKAILDALEAAGVLVDDSQVARLYTVRVPSGMPSGVRVDLARLV